MWDAHEIAGGGNGTIDRPMPALSQAGLKSGRVFCLDGGDETTVLACFDERRHHAGLGAIMAKAARLPRTASRRLRLSAEGPAAVGIALRRWRRQATRPIF